MFGKRPVPALTCHANGHSMTLPPAAALRHAVIFALAEHIPTGHAAAPTVAEWADRLGQPQPESDRHWGMGFNRALRAVAAVTATQAETWVDIAIGAVERWRLKQLLGAIEQDDARCDPTTWGRDRANEVSARRPVQARQDLADNALDHLQRAFHRYDPARPLRPWAHTILVRRLSDSIRRSRSRTSPPAEWPHRDAPADPPARLDLLRELPTVVWAAHRFPDEPDGVDYHAVFVLEVRLRLAERCADLPDPLISAEELLPWPAWVGPRRFRPGWPRLGDIWAAMRPRERIPPAGRVALVAECVRAVGSDLCLAPATWNQWIKRAKDRVRESVGEDTWEVLFGQLFLDRDRS